MILSEDPQLQRIPLSRSQQNIYNGVLQDDDPQLYLIGRSYRFRSIQSTELLAALQKAILANPVQLCVLVPPSGGGYPDLMPRLDIADIVRVCADDENTVCGDVELTHMWSSGILATPLVRYTVYVDSSGLVRGLDVHAHHIGLDGGAIGVIEAHLGRFLSGAASADIAGVGAGLSDVASAHRRESSRIDDSHERLTAVVQRELSEGARAGGHGHTADKVAGSAAKGIRTESVVIRGADYDDILALADRESVPLNVLVAAAATAVDASVRQTTDSLLVHAVDNRFGDPELDVATCLVNSIAQPVRFAPFASVADVVRSMDRGYVKAVRRRWLREEHYRRMYLALNRTTSVQALTLNFLRAPCAPELSPSLVEPPVTTHIGPIEGMTVAAVLDEQRCVLTLGIWNRPDRPGQGIPVGDRIATALKSMTTMWDHPIAMTVGEWFGIADDGTRCEVAPTPEPDNAVAPAWFLDRAQSIIECRQRRLHVDSWIAWMVQIGAGPGDVVVFTDDRTDKTVDLLIACHLAGCGYTVCDSADQVTARAERLNALGDGSSAHIVDVASANILRSLDEGHRRLVEARVEQVVTDPQLATRTAYVMPTSGSTGEPKLVHVSHGSLAALCAGVIRAYGWGPDDTILQCAPLTSDISVEEIFGAALGGAALIRSTAVKAGDLQALARDLISSGATVVDLPTAVWHLWCDDADAITAVRRSQLRQIVIGGEPIRSSAVDKWMNTGAAENISLISSYGPTETTVVVTYLPIIRDGHAVEHGARLRLGRPIVANSVVIAFGEVVVVGEMVAGGYLGLDHPGFGLVTTANGARQRAYATADRVTVDHDGYPVFAGRKDALVKIAGKRVDTAEITRRIVEDPAVVDVAVEPHNGGLWVWFETQRTRSGGQDTAAAARIRSILAGSRVPSFFVSGVARIPRKPNGKTDTASLRATAATGATGHGDVEAEERAVGLAAMWSRHLERPITPDSSLLREGVGSLDLVRILPDTRRYLGRQVSILDLISADTAANLVGDMSVDNWMDAETAAEIERDFAALSTRRAVSRPQHSSTRGSESILVLGASGVLGTGFAEAILEFSRSGSARPDAVFAMRTNSSERRVWNELRSEPGVRIKSLAPEFGPAELEALIRETGAGTLVNCIGNTNVVVPYRELRSANVELVTTMAEASAAAGTRLVHLSTYVVDADVAAPRVIDPRQAPYPYAASKALAELAVAGSSRDLDFTIVRLPRVLGTPDQLSGSADILVAIADACHALQAYPSVELTEEVTTGCAAATSILHRLPEFGGPAELGRGIDVLRGRAVAYRELLGGIARDEVDVPEWKHRLDESAWAKTNPRRWSVIDAWIGLGVRLDGRTYAQYLAEYPAVPLGIETIGELVAKPPSLEALLANGYSQ
ncbi:acyl-coenzyme A synthetase/AMP-(fatty) acid ligase/nucleoside-diphosphate-sugar epimerase [Mycobacterium frederiksbergense]|uniref:Acyl-coenzyme A synthetase/AMP-(Fatty) acid ligase/nucleoside-diphosphate-sugar epimerase n=1 Tax=Mycolicibacterium frederiksbergense TaxID=117567 RepID=A0ABT6KWJ6_9MYCO|nr:AMP-binding protein [Mycolicibacterium frederiksbergense]MDH6194626.1 acyl-coenzyme A synthetase/AMP-(fatty) acid ligase/nucleoside-diphosphate-sugar epimerase [Mycolicibacterium frederiksbergense]